MAAIALLDVLRQRYCPLHPSNHASKTMLDDVRLDGGASKAKASTEEGGSEGFFFLGGFRHGTYPDVGDRGVYRVRR